MTTPAFRRILVPVDFSPCTPASVDWAVRLALQLGAAVELFYVSEVPLVLAGDGLTHGTGELEQADIKQSRAKMAALVEDVRSRGLTDCRGEVVTGFVLDVIAERAMRGDCDFMVIGSHGRRGLSRFWMGSVAEQVVRRVAIPVMTVHPLRA
jgi:nucleotide-binding universal stress UspA family protein